ncbi:FhaA domain-containing protein [Dactylosporangium sp. NPDC049140]|uniref:FhaA domain-containing protein n=1 Tax=Dactylosporangium sp. NPDC049140 TaxID=3155647 RepID=UPI0033C5C0C3
MSLPQRTAILEAMHREAEVGEQTLAPNSYLVLVAPGDHPHLVPFAGPLARAQAEFLAEQRWGIADEVVVDLQPDDTVLPGSFKIIADVRKARTRREDEAGRGVGLLVDDGRRYTVQAGETVIGRGRQADLRVRDEGVSRRHAALRYDGRSLVLMDLDSTNGTLLNDDPVTGPTAVNPGDVITLGGVTLTVQGER